MKKVWTGLLVVALFFCICLRRIRKGEHQCLPLEGKVSAMPTDEV